MYFLHAINSDHQTRLLNVLGQIAMILGDKKKLVIYKELFNLHLFPLARNTKTAPADTGPTTVAIIPAAPHLHCLLVVVVKYNYVSL